MNDELAELILRVTNDRKFLRYLLESPREALKEFALSSEDRNALTASDVSKLATLVEHGVLVASCGSKPTCAVTCKITSALNFEMENKK